MKNSLKEAKVNIKEKKWKKSINQSLKESKEKTIKQVRKWFNT